ncbi:DUF6542 domain-containing protein [Nocardia camponoti]|uniref:DUF6542 domain-containing protein n=1 Tax=Nocardia camponoti TaxID=1616106 RepID=UPI001E49BA68|nr:DUF6542 domain-containing protein [Nocardia camponoti]
MPSVPGIPAWAAVALAAGATLLGVLIDGLGGETYPTGTVSALYVIGCVLAVCAVRFRGIFSTMVTPPLLLFVAVPIACQLLVGKVSTSLKDILTTLILPLVERFPTMMLATVLVLAIGAGRIAVYRRGPAVAPTSRQPSERATARRTERKPGRSRPAQSEPATARKRGSARPASVTDPATEVMAAPTGRGRPADKRGPAADRKNEARKGDPRKNDRGKTERKPAPARTGRPTRNAAAPREPEPARVPPRRRTDANAQAQGHPQPAVRYRDRADSSRTERRRPDAV